MISERNADTGKTLNISEGIKGVSSRERKGLTPCMTRLL